MSRRSRFRSIGTTSSFLLLLLLLLLGPATGRPPLPPGDVLGSLLAGSGATAAEFFAAHWQRTPLHASAAAAARDLQGSSSKIVLSSTGDDDRDDDHENAAAAIQTALAWRANLLTSAQVYAALADPHGAAACRTAEMVISDRTIGKGAADDVETVAELSTEPAECAFAGLDADTLRHSAATLLLPHVDDLFQSLHNVSCAVQRQLGGIPTGINAYLSPAPKAPGGAAGDAGQAG